MSSSPEKHFSAQHQRYYFYNPETKANEWCDPPDDNETNADRTRPRGLSDSTAPGTESTEPTDPAPSLTAEIENLSLNQEYQYGPQQSTTQQAVGNVKYRPKAEITDPDLYSRRKPARLKVYGTPHRGNQEELDPRYMIRPRPKQFFVVGRVIKILWPELTGYETSEKVTVLTDSKFKGESFITKIRWFVVVKPGVDCCTCLSINTYSGRGTVRRPAKWQYSMIYTGEEPSLLEGEEPGEGEQGMLTAIPVRGKDGGKMLPQSRLHYGKMYTVEHNVKVFDFGMVKSDWIPTLEAQWRYVLDNDASNGGEGQEDLASTSSLWRGTTLTPVPETPPAPKYGKMIADFVPGPGASRQIQCSEDDRLLIFGSPQIGWTEVHNYESSKRGYVPTSYVEET